LSVPIQSIQFVTGPVDIWKENELVRGSMKLVEVFHQRSEPIPRPKVPIVLTSTL